MAQLSRGNSGRGAGSGGGPGRGRGRGPITAYKKGRAPALATRLRALCGPRYHGPRPPARAAAAPRGRPRRRRRVGRCLEIPEWGPGGGVADRYRLCSGILRSGPGAGNRGSVPSPTRPGKLCWKLCPGVPGRLRDEEWGDPSAHGAPPACCASRLPLASAPPRAPGSDVTKLVSPRLPSPSRPFPGDPRAGSRPDPLRALQNPRWPRHEEGAACTRKGEGCRVLRGLVSRTGVED